MSKKVVTSNRHVNFLNFGIFYGTCLFICGFGYDEMIVHFKKKKTPKGWVTAFEGTKELWDNSNGGFASKRYVDDVSYCFLVLRKQFDFTDYAHTILAHEVLHLVSFQLKDFLDPMVENEAFCYTHTHIMNQCYKILRS